MKIKFENVIIRGDDESVNDLQSLTGSIPDLDLELDMDQEM